MSDFDKLVDELEKAARELLLQEGISPAKRRLALNVIRMVEEYRSAKH